MPSARPILKVCCIASSAEARMAADAGADWLGLVGPMPSGAGIIGLDLAGAIARDGPQGSARTVLLSMATRAADLIAEADRTGVDALQTVSHVAPETLARIRTARPGLTRIQVVHVEDQHAVDLARSYAGVADILLLDSGSPSAGELGGTARTHDWAISAQVAKASPLPVLLAGGLTPGTVDAALRTVAPAGLDVCSGLRTGGALDPERLRAFATALRAEAA